MTIRISAVLAVAAWAIGATAASAGSHAHQSPLLRRGHPCPQGLKAHIEGGGRTAVLTCVRRV